MGPSKAMFRIVLLKNRVIGILTSSPSEMDRPLTVRFGNAFQTSPLCRHSQDRFELSSWRVVLM